MGIARVTAHPRKYQYMELIEELLDAQHLMGAPCRPAGAPLRIQFELADAPSQRRIARALAGALRCKAVYLRDGAWKSAYNQGCYEAAGWTVAGGQVSTAAFSLSDLPGVLGGLEALRAQGYRPDGEVDILLTGRVGPRQALNLSAMLEEKRELLEAALRLEGEIRVVVSDTVALGIPLSAFDLPRIEAGACLLHQLALRAAGTACAGPARTAQPRRQLAAWLCQLGFDCEALARPARTLLNGLAVGGEEECQSAAARPDAAQGGRAPLRRANPGHGLAPSGAGEAPKRVAVYCRVSTEMELQKGSFERQMSCYRELVAADRGMALAGVYGDKGRTGRSIAARPEFRRMLADCEAGRIDLILTKSISRFARNMGECIEVLRRLKELGIPVVFEKEGLNSMDAQGELMLSIFAAIAQEESNSLSQNMLWANERRNAAGQPHFKPSYGYTKARGEWEWHIDEAQARRVRLAFQLAEQEVSYCGIRQALNAMEREERTGLKWTYERLRYLLTNANYTGDYLTNRHISARGGKRGTWVNRGERAQYLIEEHHAPLVSRERFKAVQDKLCAGALRSREMPHLPARRAAAWARVE